MDQAERLRSLMSSEEHRARVLAVTSGKGGVGKTNISVNLAVALAKMGKRVVLIDVDIGLSNADVLLNVQPRFHLGHVLSGEVAPLEALISTDYGVFLLPGSNGTVSISDLTQSERDFLVDSFRRIESYADFVIVDTGAGISRNVVQFASAADEVVVVTTPEPTAITDGYAMIKTASRQKGCGPIRLIVNQANDRTEAGQVADRLRMVSRKFLGVEVDTLGHILVDERIRMSVRRRRPFVVEFPRSPGAGGIRQICERVLGENRPRPKQGFFKRFAEVIDRRSES